ncbi:MAG: DUF2062 domain-containing protein [Candidatus Omnitrophica bacterium]|nr:DUF2062 domain-containing protein [Candidatus Omnitrophota bacterium]
MNNSRYGLLKRLTRFVYAKLFAINDTPQKVAIGVGIGVFLGVFPGLGPLAALFMAFLFRVNRAGALLGSALTNTWISIPIFVMASGLGSVVTGVNYGDVKWAWRSFIDNPSWDYFWKLSASKVFVPIITGYLIISLLIGVMAYLAALFAMKAIEKTKARRAKGRDAQKDIGSFGQS